MRLVIEGGYAGKSLASSGGRLVLNLLESLTMTLRTKAPTGRMLELKCKHCGKAFTRPLSWVKRRPTGPFCSKRCSGLAPRTRQKIKCETCGKVVERAPSFITKAKHHYCSRACKDKRGRSHQITIKCALCGKKVKFPPCRKGIRKYCSRACSDKGRRRRVTLECGQCGKPFEVFRSEAKVRKNCSVRCQHLAMRGKKRG